MDKVTVKAKMYSAWNEYGAVVDELTKSMRDSLVVPLCDKNGWEFVAGMGAWCFIIDKKVVNPAYNCEYEDINKISEILNIAVPGMPSNDFGSLMDSYGGNEK